MHKITAVLFLTLLCFARCKEANRSGDMATWKAEIRAVEKEFNDLAQTKGLAIAFEKYAAPNGVIRKAGKVIQGPKAMGDWYRNDSRPGETLTWEPDFIDVSLSGDLAYTYGGYIFTSIDSTGLKKENTGTFHTVWKRQPDGSWKFVWD
ncbi:MAG: nuclear transport factor 2 family protein [Maribacter sp.]|uniref:YybH family protein n=1 Tax=Maribacter sp. TaxID=1897614 RepID=UPI0032999923